MNFTIIIPIYNEEDNLLRVENELSNYIEKSSFLTKVLLVDDGSKDNSLKLIKEICQRNRSFEFITFEKNAGLSAAIKAGFDYTNTSWVGYIDADLQTSPEDFEKLIPYTKDFDLVTGVRSNRKDSFGKNLSSKIANGIRRSFTNDEMDDTGCPLKIIRTEMAKKIPMFSGLHRFLPAMILLQNGKVKQTPVSHFPRTAGESKFNMWNRLLGPLSDCFAYLWMKRKYINYQVKETNVNS